MIRGVIPGLGSQAGQRADSHLPRHGSHAGHRVTHPTKQEYRDCQNQPRNVPDAVGNSPRAVSVGGRRHHPCHGEQHARQQNADDCGNYIGAPADADLEGKNQVARAEKHGKQGKPGN